MKAMISLNLGQLSICTVHHSRDWSFPRIENLLEDIKSIDGQLSNESDVTGDSLSMTIQNFYKKLLYLHELIHELKQIAQHDRAT